MLQKTRAIILHAFKYGDSSLIVHAITEEWGRQSFLLKGVRKSKKNNRSNMFQPFFLLDLDIYYRENRDMHWIKEASFIYSAPTFIQDVVKSTQAVFLCEILMKTISEEEKNPALFNFIFHSVEYLETVKPASPAFHLMFLFQLSGYLGFFPRNNSSASSVYFDAISGSFSSSPASMDLTYERMVGQAWRSCFKCDYSSINQEFTNHTERNAFLDSLLKFYKLHHHSMAELKSLDVLRTVFN